MSDRYFTEVRISHPDRLTKLSFERRLDEALRRAGYENRVEFFREKAREIIGITAQTKKPPDR